MCGLKRALLPSTLREKGRMRMRKLFILLEDVAATSGKAERVAPLMCLLGAADENVVLTMRGS